MRPRFLRVLLFAGLLIPSAQYAWRNPDMPEFASLHDDGIFFVSGKSIADGLGYRIASLPETPMQTKVPPLYPLCLSFIWRLNPSFPENLALGRILSWLVLVVCLAMVWRYYRAMEFSEEQAWVMTACLGLCPYVILFGTNLFSEIPFVCFLLGALLLARRESTVSIVLAGALAACAYLTRTAGIALLISVPAALLWRGARRQAGIFAAVMLPAVVGWMVWTRSHQVAHPDLTMIYYTDYIGIQLVNVGLDNLAVVLWKNIDAILYAMGSLALPQVIDLLPVKILTQVLAVAMIAGAVRLVRRGICVDYAIFGLVATGILLVWNYPANERFLLPLFPLLLCGFWAEMEHFSKMLKTALTNAKRIERYLATGLCAVLACILVVSIGLQFYVGFVYLPQLAEQKRRVLAQKRRAYAWMKAELPAEATVLSYDDPLLYLYSGHRGNGNPFKTRWWYADEHVSIVNAYRNLEEYCWRRGLTYVYFRSDDLSRDTGEEDRKAIVKVVQTNPALEAIFTDGAGTVYRVKPHHEETVVSQGPFSIYK